MVRRLYLRLYFAFLGVLVAIITLTVAVNYFVGRPIFGFLRAGPRMASHLTRMLPSLDRREMLDRAVQEMHDELGVDVAVVAPDGTVVASAGQPIPVDPAMLAKARKGPGWLPGRGVVGGPVRGTPGAVVVARLPIPENAGRAAVLRAALFLLGLLAVSLALIYPLSRSITRPVEKLTAAVQAYGRGDLSRRSGLGDLKDEVGQLARSFDEMADRIQSARRAERELLANVSHELRTPLARMKVALELIEAPDESVKRRLASVGEEVDELDRLIADILTATRLDLAALPLHKIRLKAADLVDKARLRALALQPALLVEARVEPGLEMEADEALLSRALDNLLDNARKYGNGSAIEVDARREGGEAVLAVRDHGPGIPAEELGHVFDPFFRGDSARGRASGFGLGLALARKVAEAHGGGTKAGNAQGGGALIELRVPSAPQGRGAGPDPAATEGTAKI
jgi:signal transduction histidine kinase